MPARTLPNLGLRGFYDDGEDNWGDNLSADLLKLSVLVQGGVLGRVAAVPGAPAAGDTYVLTAAPNANAVAVYDDGAWVYYAPLEGWSVWDRGGNMRITFDGAAWVEETGGGGDASFPPFEGNAGKALLVNAEEDGVEWGTVQGGGGGGSAVPALASARYWRIHNARSLDGTPSAAEIQFRETVGGPVLIPTSVVSNSNNGDQVIGKAFDGDNNTVWSASRPDNVSIVIDFGQDKTPAEITVVSRSDVGPNANLRDFDLYYSDDGKTWDHAGFISLPDFTGAAQSRAAAIPMTVLRADKGNVEVVGDEAAMNYPDLTGFVWVNQRGALVSADSAGTRFVSPQFAGNGTYTHMVTACPAGDFDLYVRWAAISKVDGDYPVYSASLRSSATGRGLHLGGTTANNTLYLQDVNDNGSFNGNRFSRQFNRMPTWLRLSRRGTLIIGYASVTGLDWSKIGQWDSAGLNIDQMGVGFIPSAPTDNILRVLHFGTEAPVPQSISGGGPVAAGYRKIASVDLAGKASHSFENIPQTGRSLRLVITGKLTASADVGVRMNGNAGAIYDTQRMYTNRLRQDNVATDHFRAEDAWKRFPTFPGTDSPATGVIQLDFDNYAQTNSYKSGMFNGRQPDADSTAAYVITGTFQSRLNEAIASLLIYSNAVGQTFAAGSQATLYILGEEGPPVDEGASSGGDLVTGWRKTSDGWLEQWGRIVPGGGNQDINFPVPFTQGVAAITGACIEGTDNINTLFAINFSAITLTKFRAHPRFATNGNVNNPGEAFNWFARGK